MGSPPQELDTAGGGRPAGGGHAAPAGRRGARPGRTRRRLIIALLLSVGLHGLLFLVPLCEPPPPETREMQITHLTLPPEAEPETDPVEALEPDVRPEPEPSETEIAEAEPETRPEPVPPEVENAEATPEARPEPAPPPEVEIAEAETDLAPEAMPAEPEAEREIAHAPSAAADDDDAEADLPDELAAARDADLPPDAETEPDAPPPYGPRDLYHRDRPGVDLLPQETLARLGRELASPPEAHAEADPGETLHAPPSPPSPESRAEMAERRLAAYVREEKAHHRVERGLVDPYFVRLREDFDGTFAPSWGDFDEETAEGLASALGAWLREYQQTLDRYGATGSPYNPGETSSVGANHPLAAPPPPVGTIGHYDSRMVLRNFMAMHVMWADTAQGRLGGIELVAIVRVVQAPDGGLLEVEIARSSGRARYDDLARRAVRDALTEPRRPERAGDGLGLEGERIESLWAFRARFVVMPPLPIAGCEIESDGTRGDCLGPLQRRTLPKIELMAVY